MGKLQRGLADGLILWVRQLAWLNATPKPDPHSRRGKAAPDGPRHSRLEDLKRRKIAPQMPPNPAPHITDWLVEIGLMEAAGMGAVPVTWCEIDAWATGVCVTLQPWERRLLRRLSAAYLAEGRKAESESCPPPWRTTTITARERELEDAELRSVLG